IFTVLLGCLSAFPCAAARPAAVRHLPSTEATVPVTWSVAEGANAAGDRRWVETVRVGQATLTFYATSPRAAEDDGERMAHRFDAIGSQPGEDRRMALATVAGTPTLVSAGRVVRALSERGAADYGKTAAEVVGGWVEALHHVHSVAEIPPIVRIPVGDVRQIFLPPGWSLSPQHDRRIVGVTGAGRLTGVAAGTTALLAVHGALHRDIPVVVERTAGTVPYSLHLSISGPWLRDLALEGLSRDLFQKAALDPAAGVSASWDMVPQGPPEQAPMTVWAEGKGLASAVRNVQVSVSTGLPAPAAATTLLASNNPEDLVGPGTLLDEPVSGTAWYYYHHHDLGDARTLRVSIENRGSAPARVLVTASGAGPSPDEIYVGHLATWRFLHWAQLGAAWAVDIPSGGRYDVERRYLAPGEISAGLGLVQTLQGSDVHFVVQALGGGQVDDPKANRAVRARGAYPAPSTDVQASYAAKGPWCFVDLGGPPYPESDGLPNPGNYGVLYHVRLHLDNPTTETQKAYVVFAAGGGPARGSLRVDGTFMETPVVGANPGQKREAALADYDLAPGEQRDVDLLAIPEPGSNYPVRIVVKSLPANH
ncbi:MAG TPA: hypothetical protein VGO93_16350, partial [Candidatus Xenobia bacterium]